MAKKLKDIVVKTGTYTDSNGLNKNRYKTVGVLLEGEYGPYIMLDRTFNPAGVPSNDSNDRIILSLFAPRDQQSDQQPGEFQQSQNFQQPTPQPAPKQTGTLDDDDVPF